VYLAWLTDRHAARAGAPVSLAFASGLSLGPRRGRRRLVVALGSRGLVHLSAASLWIGGLVSLVVAVWFVAPALRREAFRRFSRLATVLIALVLAAGTYLSIVRLPQLSDLWTTSYGRVLLVKLSLVAVVLAWGAFHHFLVRPAPGASGVLSRVGRSLAGGAPLASPSSSPRPCSRTRNRLRSRLAAGRAGASHAPR
jgi:hypothetical protein